MDIAEPKQSSHFDCRQMTKGEKPVRILEIRRDLLRREAKIAHGHPAIQSSNGFRAVERRRRCRPALRLEAFRQRHLVAAVAMLRQMPRGVRLRVEPHRIRVYDTWPDAGWNPERHRASRDFGPRRDDRTRPDERSRAAGDPLEDDRARTDEYQVLENAALELGQV